VVDFTQAVAGPVATMLLGFLGAEVIKVETIGRPQARRTDQPGFAELNRNKLSATINAQDPGGYEMALRLIERSDVVIDNFRAGVMDRMGLGYEDLKKVKPDIVVVQMPGMGLTGPLKDYITYGQQVFGFCGLGYLWGHADGRLETRPKVGYTDYVAGAATAGAVCVALEHRRQTGRGQFLEAAQVEALGALLGAQYLDYTVNGHDPGPQGNVSDRFAPHDVYPCLGRDAWCAIVCRDDDDWRRLVTAMGSPEWARDPRWQTLEGRLTGREELDGRISEWTRTLTPRQVMHKLQRFGVPAGVDQSPEALVYDPHLRVRGSIVSVQAAPPWNSRIEHPALPARLSDTPGDSTVPAPTEGQDNDYVFREVMGLTEDEVVRLITEGALK
jgi:crotonobetainyl-CoA:carnitine CoA-transferase CaiB-like acyl-CoA transferase